MSRVRDFADSGGLEECPLPKLLVSLYAERWDGALALTRDRTQKRIILREGAPVLCESNLASESLGVQLMDAGQISREQHARVSELVQKKQCQEGMALLALELLEPKALFVALKEQLRRRIVECFGWVRGRYALDPQAEPPQDVQPFRTDPYWLVREGLVAHWSAERLLGDLAPQLSKFPRRTRNFSDVAKRVAVGPEEQRACAAVDGARRFDQVLGAGANDPGVLASAWLLDVSGAVAFYDAPEAEGAAPEIEVEVQKSQNAEKASRPAANTTKPGKAAAAPGGVHNPEAEKMREEVLDRHARLAEFDLYGLLEISATAKPVEIKKAYFKAAKRYHPDALGRLDLADIRPQAGEVFSQIAKAYEVLSDVGRRRDYDASLAAGDTGLDAADVERIAQAEAQYRKGEIMVRMGDFRGALEYLQAAVDLWPDECAYQSGLGWALYKKAPPEIERAVEHLAIAVEKDGSDAVANFRLGVVLRAQGHEDEAAEFLARAKRLDPKVS